MKTQSQLRNEIKVGIERLNREQLKEFIIFLEQLVPEDAYKTLTEAVV